MITLYSHKQGPNGWKVVIVLEALGLKYETKYLDFSKNEQKDPSHTQFNPNGRIPTIIDHDNDDFALWESNAIIKYLVDRYDKDNTIHFGSGTKESYLLDQWMTFQVSGQGPYFGQVAHFARFHPVKLPTAIERYQKEIVRVISVLDDVLAKKQYLVGDKPTIADFCFLTWNAGLSFLLAGAEEGVDDLKKKYKNFFRWDTELHEHPAVKKAFEIRAKALEG